MSDTLRDQLLGLGFKPAPKPERKPERKQERGPQPSGGPRGAHPGQARKGPHGGRPDGGKPGAHAKGGRPGQAGQPGRGQQAAGKPRMSQGEIDLAKAYAIRAQKEKDERIEAERLKQEEARVRREAKAKLELLLKDKALNEASADIARHFPYGGKIKRIYVTEPQLKALNAGELGVVQLNGRYLLVSAAVLAEAESTFGASVALKVDPNAPSSEDPYADPQYQIPDDLIW